MTTVKKRKKNLIVSYKNLTEELKEKLKEAYPDGYNNYLQRFTKPNGETIFVVPFETNLEEDEKRQKKLSLGINKEEIRAAFGDDDVEELDSYEKIGDDDEESADEDFEPSDEDIRGIEEEYFDAENPPLDATIPEEEIAKPAKKTSAPKKRGRKKKTEK